MTSGWFGEWAYSFACGCKNGPFETREELEVYPFCRTHLAKPVIIHYDEPPRNREWVGKDAESMAGKKKSKRHVEKCHKCKKIIYKSRMAATRAAYELTGRRMFRSHSTTCSFRTTIRDAVSGISRTWG